ncbi:YlbD family protein [Cytobacillus sp. Hz8]|uniref:YlbD family protein n=1 Tax=Cytobacillus sp. Hz8 TaxID=3347168 RepID=UPI0035DC0164
MKSKNLHPSIIKFKEFVRENPHILKEVRNGNSTLQELYEDWYLLGEDDPKWNGMGIEKEETTVKEDKKENDWLSKIMNNVSKMDPNQIQSHLYNANQAISAILGVISQFQGQGQTQQPPQQNQSPHPFSFRKD